ncbi:MAG: SDR family oxidoreductase [Gemmatimonadaceae bacterium]|nr:SDR family oxidoreductase [Gemmatimonadaceae bacterium]
MTERRVCLVTGGARRVGAAIVRDRAQRGDAVVIHHGSSPREAAALAAEVEALGSPALVVQADLADPNAPARIVEHTMATFGRLDIVVSSASLMTRHSFDAVTVAEWDEVEAVNLRAPFFLMQAAARVMREGGVLIQLSDHLATETGFPQLIPHQVTKAAVTQLVATLAVELAPRLRVNAVAPGLVLPPDDMTDTALAAFLRDVPLQRAGTPRDVAEAIHFLIEATYITGVVLAVDGGRALRR